MALSTEQLHTATALLLELEPGANPLPAMRARLPGVALTRCDADDLEGAPPYCRSGAYNLFLVDTISHCWRLVGAPEEASGLLLASRH
ncbi:HCV capsid domain containing protein [Oxalobacteraceae bacterium A2-2]